MLAGGIATDVACFSRPHQPLQRHTARATYESQTLGIDRKVESLGSSSNAIRLHRSRRC